MEYKGLVSKLSLPNGFFYTSTDLAHVFIDSMTNNYIKNLINRSEWAIKQLRNKENDVFKIVFKRAINNWSNEFEILDAKKHNNDRN